MWGLGFPIKLKEREKEKDEAARKKKKTLLFSPIPEIMFSYILFISFSIDMQGKVIFLDWKDTKTFEFQKNCEIYSIFSFQFIWWVWMFFYAYFLWLFSLIIRADSKLLF